MASLPKYRHFCRNVGTCSEFVNFSRSAFVPSVSCGMMSNADTLRNWGEGELSIPTKSVQEFAAFQPGHRYRKPYISPMFRILTREQSALFLLGHTWDGDRNANMFYNLMQMSCSTAAWVVVVLFEFRNDQHLCCKWHLTCTKELDIYIRGRGLGRDNNMLAASNGW